MNEERTEMLAWTEDKPKDETHWVPLQDGEKRKKRRKKKLHERIWKMMNGKLKMQEEDGKSHLGRDLEGAITNAGYDPLLPLQGLGIP